VAQFPTLKTGAVAQYPVDRTRRFSTRIFRFLDGVEQRFPDYGVPLRRWSIRLDLLDEAELNSFGDFLTAQGGRAGAFSFTDPFDGIVYPNCSFDQDELTLTFVDAGRGATVVAIKENRI